MQIIDFSVLIEKMRIIVYNVIKYFLLLLLREGINIDKTIKRKMWLKHRNEKNLKLRTKKKLARKLKLTKENEYNRSLKKDIKYNHKSHNYIFSAPLDFSFISNPNETNDFFNGIIKFIIRKKNFGKKVFIDVSKIQNLTIDALMYLLAIVNNINEKFDNKCSFSGNAPRNEHIRKMFMESGFYDYVKHNGHWLIVKNSDTIKIVSGNNSNTKVAKQIAEFVIEKSKINRVQAHFIYIMMIEMMSNTHKHAYNSNTLLLPRWYCYAEFDKSNNNINFTFMDTGDGIAATVYKNFTEKVDFLNLKTDDKYVVSALNGDFRTETELIKHGKGLPKIREFCNNRKIENMKILANRANVSVLNDGYKTKLLNNSFRGTLYYWQINFNNLKGEKNDKN